MNNFEQLGIIDRILKAISLEGYTEPTPIQQEAIPALLAGRDMLGSAQTGTGKTAAFAIPILQELHLSKKGDPKRVIRALVLTPTRELAGQISENFTNYARYVNIKNVVIYGGVKQKKQEVELARGTDILIATPGRLLDLINQKIISLTQVEYLVLDEADQMLDMGFIKDVNKIISYVKKDRQTMLFSATMPKSIELLSKQILNDPIRVAVTPVTQTLDVINQSLYHVAKKKKTALLMHLVKAENMDSVLVFTRTKQGANRVVKELLSSNIKAEAIHGNKSQSAREKALANFKASKTNVLVATDIAARGIDIDALSYVFNYDLPEVPETYIHRIGRTGRAGLSGKAIAFCDPQEKDLLKGIEKHTNRNLDVIEDHPYSLKGTPEEHELPVSKPQRPRKNNQNKDSYFKTKSASSPTPKNSKNNASQHKTFNQKSQRHKTSSK